MFKVQWLSYNCPIELTIQYGRGNVTTNNPTNYKLAISETISEYLCFGRADGDHHDILYGAKRGGIVWSFFISGYFCFLRPALYTKTYLKRPFFSLCDFFFGRTVMFLWPLTRCVYIFPRYVRYDSVLREILDFNERDLYVNHEFNAGISLPQTTKNLTKFFHWHKDIVWKLGYTCKNLYKKT